ncbi:hypothetical protein NQZ68_013057 [Dissostichus eleginoides]|nr:hypothetical protein NQZ68_013057 [Dissostichus eleginoides]
MAFQIPGTLSSPHKVNPNLFARDGLIIALACLSPSSSPHRDNTALLLIHMQLFILINLGQQLLLRDLLRWVTDSVAGKNIQIFAWLLLYPLCPPPNFLSPRDGEHVSVAMRAVECSRSAAAGVTFPLSLLNLINYGSEQKPREKGERKPTTLSEP